MEIENSLPKARNEAVCPPKPTLLVPMFNAKLLRRSFQGSTHTSIRSIIHIKRKERHKQDTLKYRRRVISRYADVFSRIRAHVYTSLDGIPADETSSFS